MKKSKKKDKNIIKKKDEVDWDLVRQVKASLEDVKAGRIRRVA